MRIPQLVVALALCAGLVQAADEPKAITGEAAFETMKKFAGNWKGPMLTEDGPEGAVTYAITAGGSVIEEKLFPGLPHEMITMYHMDGEDLVATHYCSGGNQPKMKFNARTSTPELLVFDFVSVTGLDRPDEAHIHDLKVRLLGPDRIDAEWASVKGDKPEGTKKFFLSRAK
ncbi:MAG: hypothetical protein ACYC7A_22450 [Thermoanaerobaculia bacterium]